MHTNSRTNQKIIDILKKMDEVFTKKGFNEYQERLHRIYKTVNSIQLHSECVVSRFSPDLNKKFYIAEDIPHDLSLYNSEYLSVCEDNEVEMESDARIYKLNLDELFKYIENQLNINQFMNESTSSSFESDDDNNLIPGPVKRVKEINQINIQKKLFKIELKLRAYIKEQEAFKNILEGTPVKAKCMTPVSKMCNNSLPSILNSFFEDGDCINKDLQRANQRHSMKDNHLQTLKEFSEANQGTKNFTSELMKIGWKSTAPSKTSQFNAEVEVKSFTIEKEVDYHKGKDSLDLITNQKLTKVELETNPYDSQEEGLYTSDEDSLENN